MIRAKRVSFRASKKEMDRLFTCHRESALVWNELSKQYDMDHKKWISKSELQKATKWRNLHSQSIQAVCHFPQNKRIYGSLRRKVVDGLFRPLYPRYLLLT